MKRAASALPSFLLASSGVIISLMPYHAFLSTWFGSLFGWPLFFKSWKEILLLAMVFAGVAILALRPDVERQFFASFLTKCIFAFAALHILLAIVFHPPLEPTIAGLLTNLRFLALFLLVQLVVLLLPDKAKKWQAWLTRALAVSAVAVSVIGLLQVSALPKDFLVPFGYDKATTIAPFIMIDEQEHALRAFATLRGPNTLGMFLLLPAALLLVLISRKQRLALTVPALVLVVAAVCATGSRSAWLGLAVTFAVIGLVLLGRKKTLRYAVKFGVPLLAIATALVIAAIEYPPLRLAIFHSNPNDPTLTEGSTDAHWHATASGFIDAAQHPFGRGPGQAGPASFYNPDGARIAENYFVQLAQEVGIFGLVLFLMISFIVARKLWQLATQPNTPPLTIALLASFWGIAIINLLLHGWADDPTSLVWWGLAGFMITLHNPQHGTRQQIAAKTA